MQQMGVGGRGIHTQQRGVGQPEPDSTPLGNFCCPAAVLSEEAFKMLQSEARAAGFWTLGWLGIMEKPCLVRYLEQSRGKPRDVV